MIRNGQPNIDDPDITAEAEFRRGQDHAASIEEPTRTQIYRRMYRTSQTAFARGFRAFVIRGGYSASH